MMQLYTPVYIKKIIERVREQHPVSGSAVVWLGSSVVDKVRQQLADCSINEVPHLAEKFEPKEVLACLEIVVTDREGEIANKAASVLRMRPRNQVLLYGWRKLVRLYPHGLLESTIRELLNVKDYKVLERSRQKPDLIAVWFQADSFGKGVFQAYKTSSHEKCLDDYLELNSFEDQDGLYQWVWRHLLTRGDSSDLKKETGDRILKELTKSMNASHLPGFCQHYLNALKEQTNWYESILNLIKEKYNGPKGRGTPPAMETPFWQGVSDSAKDEYRTWLMLRQIEDFFEGERADFWKPYVDQRHVHNVSQILDKQGFMLDFGAFGVVEFKKIGNAAYIYPKHVFKEYWADAKWRDNPSHFKDRERTVSASNWDGRIIHHGNWQERTAIIIQALLEAL